MSGQWLQGSASIRQRLTCWGKLHTGKEAVVYWFLHACNVNFVLDSMSITYYLDWSKCILSCLWNQKAFSDFFELCFLPFICFKFLPFLATVPLLFVWVICVHFITFSLCWLLNICMQSVTPNLALGGEIFWVGQHRKSGLGSSARYSNDKMVIWLDFIWVLHKAFVLFLLNCLIGFLSCYIIWVKNGVLSTFPSSLLHEKSLNLQSAKRTLLELESTLH